MLLTLVRPGAPLHCVICDRCGSNNPDHLIFCQECGLRLQPKRRVVPPTPPAGMPVAPEAATLPSPEARARAQDPIAASAAEVVCPRCQTRNPASGRFCVSCGATFGAEAAARPPPSPQVVEPVAKPAGPLRTAAMVQVAAPEPAKTPSITCERCQGTSDIGMRFCKYCGAPLPSLADPPAPAAPAVPDAFASRTSPGAYGPAKPVAPYGPAPQQDRARTRPQSSQSPQEVGESLGATSHYVPFAGMSTLPSGRLVIIGGDGQEGPSFPLTGDQVDIGRAEGAVVLAEDKYMSLRHARLLRTKGKWVVRDLDSVNGVFVRLTKPHDLVAGDLLLLGVEVLRFETVMDAELGLGPAIEHGTLVFGSPALPRPARLVQRTVEGVARDVYHLHRPETIIGRESGDIVFTDDPYMSRRHAMITRSASTGSFSLMDLDSSNGSFVAIRGDHPLQDGDSIRVGQHLFRLELAPS